MEAQKSCGKTLKDFNQRWANRVLLLNSLSNSMGDPKQRIRETTIGWDNEPNKHDAVQPIIVKHYL